MGLRVARWGTNSAFDAAERISNTVHPTIQSGVKQVAATAATVAGLAGLEETAMAGATATSVPVVSALQLSERLTSWGINFARDIALKGLYIGSKAADTVHDSLREYAVSQGWGTAASNAAALAATEFCEIMIQLFDRIPQGRSMIELGEAFMVYGRLQRALRRPYPPSNAPALVSGDPATEQLFLHVLPRLYRYVLATYGYTWLRALGFSLPNECVSNEDIMCYVGGLARHGEPVTADTGGVLWTDWESSVGRTAFAVLEDPHLEAIVILIRGSANLSDCLTDLSVKSSTSLENGIDGHPGMHACAKDFDERFRSRIIEHLDARPPGWKVLISGHSLGAGVAQWLSYMWQDEDFFEGGHAYGFSAPCAMSLEAGLQNKKMTTLVTGPDFVSRWSHSTRLILFRVNNVVSIFKLFYVLIINYAKH